MDFPTAWRVARDMPPEMHDEKCSFRTTGGAVLCDCEVLESHPDPCDCHPEPEVQPKFGRGPFFASPEEEEAERMDWLDQIEAVADARLPAPVESRDEVLVESDDVDPLDIPDHYDLPMHGSIPVCPKCGNDSLRVDYHAHGVLGDPCGNRFGWPDVQNLGEHLCLTCTRCKYGWPEQVRHGAA
jgi:hypothetical protein